MSSFICVVSIVFIDILPGRRIPVSVVSVYLEPPYSGYCDISSGDNRISNVYFINLCRKTIIRQKVFDTFVIDNRHT